VVALFPDRARCLETVDDQKPGADRAQRDRKRWVGLFEGQGFLFSRARPNAGIISLLAAQRGIDGDEEAAALVA
jgi:hypothetical protein